MYTSIKKPCLGDRVRRAGGLGVLEVVRVFQDGARVDLKHLDLCGPNFIEQDVPQPNSRSSARRGHRSSCGFPMLWPRSFWSKPTHGASRNGRLGRRRACPPSRKDSAGFGRCDSPVRSWYTSLHEAGSPLLAIAASQWAARPPCMGRRCTPDPPWVASWALLSSFPNLKFLAF